MPTDPFDEAKEDMAKRGASSPDRADAVLGAIMVGSHLSGAVTAAKVAGSVVGESPFEVGIVTGF